MRLNHKFAIGRTGLRPVVSGVAPETRGVVRAVRVIFLGVFNAGSRRKSGATPDLTGVTPVLP